MSSAVTIQNLLEKVRICGKTLATDLPEALLVSLCASYNMLEGEYVFCFYGGLDLLDVHRGLVVTNRRIITAEKNHHTGEVVYTTFPWRQIAMMIDDVSVESDDMTLLLPDGRRVRPPIKPDQFEDFLRKMMVAIKGFDGGYGVLIDSRLSKQMKLAKRATKKKKAGGAWTKIRPYVAVAVVAYLALFAH